MFAWIAGVEHGYMSASFCRSTCETRAFLSLFFERLMDLSAELTFPNDRIFMDEDPAAVPQAEDVGIPHGLRFSTQTL
jgi:hypothetical protein